MKKIVLVAESGSDIPKDLAKRYGITIVPMHVSFETETVDDGDFPLTRIESYYRSTGKLPTTSGSTPNDFERAFDQLHKKYPKAIILYLAYSAQTTISYQSAKSVSENRDYVIMLDTKQVSVGQGIVVMAVADYIQKHKLASVEEVVEYAKDRIAKAHMCFLPDDLEYLKAGGRVSNVAYMGARLLHMHPGIEIIDGKLVATKRYRGKMLRVVQMMIKEITNVYQFDTRYIALIYSIGLSDDVKKSAEQVVRDLGFQTFEWICVNGVITTHCGPASFGIAGFTK